MRISILLSSFMILLLAPAINVALAENSRPKGALVFFEDVDIIPPHSKFTAQQQPNLTTTPPIPPRRPDKFSVSHQLMQSLGEHKQNKSPPSSHAPSVVSPSNPRSNTPPIMNDIDKETLEIRAMDVHDIYKNITTP